MFDRSSAVRSNESRVTPQALVISKGARTAAIPPDLAPHYATITTGVSASELAGNSNSHERVLPCSTFFAF